MLGHGFMALIMVLYCVTALAFAWEGNWWKMWYWLAALQITFTVYWMK